MSLAEIKKLVAKGESDRVEFTVRGGCGDCDRKSQSDNLPSRRGQTMTGKNREARTRIAKYREVSRREREASSAITAGSKGRWRRYHPSIGQRGENGR